MIVAGGPYLVYMPPYSTHLILVSNFSNPWVEEPPVWRPVPAQRYPTLA